MFATNRKISYKLPPTTIRDKLISQEARRSKALEEQKRRRARKVDSSRQLDFFAGLSLAEHSEDENQEETPIEDDQDTPESRLAPASVVAYVSLLQAGETNDNLQMHPTSEGHALTQDVSGQLESSTSYEAHEEASVSAPSEPKKSRKRGGKNSHKRRSEANKTSNSNKYKTGNSQWADKCMYAELLEMNGDDIWDAAGHDGQVDNDGLPSDLEHGWVAVAPVPKGKRCLVVTQQSAGVAGVVPNTTLRSRLLGKSLLSRFPSPLPPLTVLDCILDDNWKQNGILHVLDVVRWKGQDVADCEAGFRFWWRDTRLAELTQSPPPTFHFVASSNSSPAASDPISPQKNGHASQMRYTFPYPTTFVPVPYHSCATLAALDTQVIPSARSVREVPITLPVSTHPFTSTNPGEVSSAVDGGGEMEIEPLSQSLDTISVAAPTAITALVHPDGLLLYVAEASYEPGTSPLSSWIPIQGYDEPANDGVDSHPIPAVRKEGPLDLFHRLVKKRIARTPNVMSDAQFVVIDASSGTGNSACESGAGDVTMEL